MNSSNKISVYLQTGKAAAKEPPHEALANLQDDEDSVRAFVRKWGVLSNFPLVDAARMGWRDMLRKAWEGDAGAIQEIQGWVGHNMKASFAFKDGHFEIQSDTLLGTIFLLFLRDYFANHIAVCGNRIDCKQPYFVKKRASQKFCSLAACSAFAQREYAKKWWHEEGKELRETRRKKAGKKRGKK